MRVLAMLWAATLLGQTATVSLRTGVKPWQNAPWKQIGVSGEIDPVHTALVICDRWDKRRCPTLPGGEPLRALAARP